MPAKAWPTTCSGSSSASTNPKAVAFGSQPHSMWLPQLVLWTKRGMAYLYLSTPKGQTVAFILCTKAASAFAISVFNPLVSRELLR